jgi:uridine kinase
VTDPAPLPFDVSRAERRPEYEALAGALADLLARDYGVGGGARRVIGVAGETGSGKSVTAAGLARELTRRGVPAAVVHQDDYFLRPPQVNHAHRERDLAHVGPHEVNLALIADHIAAFRAGRDGVQAPLVDYPGDRFLTQRLDFAPLAALVVEGTYVLALADLDARLFLEATHEETRARRRARNRDAETPIEGAVLAIEHAVIARQAAAADVIVDREFRVRWARPAGGAPPAGVPDGGPDGGPGGAPGM